MRTSILLSLAAFAATTLASVAPDAPAPAAPPAAPAYPSYPKDDASPPYPPKDDASPVVPDDECAEVVYVTTTVLCTETAPVETVYAPKPLNPGKVEEWAGQPPKYEAPAPSYPPKDDSSPPAAEYPHDEASPPKGDYPNEAPNDYAKKALKAHNDCRARHGTPAVKWSPSLAADAYNWAKGCRGMVHEGKQGQGENLYASSASKAADPSVGIIDSWYAEEPKYPYGDVQSMSKGWGHFTQIVWAGTTEVGCATVNCPKGSGVLSGTGGHLLVCRYKAPGNYGGQYKNNVPRKQY